MSNVINLVIRRTQSDYQKVIAGMDKLQLLDEMVRYAELREQQGSLTPELIAKGLILFKAIEQNAETQELKILSRSYHRHLTYESHTCTSKKS